MTLRTQLLLVSLVTLALPWAGCQYLREMEQALRMGQEKALISATISTASFLASAPEHLYPHPARLAQPQDPQSINARHIDWPIILDGYDHEWQELPAVPLPAAGPGAHQGEYRAAIYRKRLFLLVDIKDKNRVFYDPTLLGTENGDRLHLILADDPDPYVIAPSAPGYFYARRNTGFGSQSHQNVAGFWQETAGGYRVEFSLPLSMTEGKMALVAVDGNAPSSNDLNAPPGWLALASGQLNQRVAPFVQYGQTLQVLDKGQWVLAHTGADPREQEIPRSLLLKSFYHLVLENSFPVYPYTSATVAKRTDSAVMDALAGEVSAVWYKAVGNTEQHRLVAAAPIWQKDEVIGAVVVEQSSEQFLLYADRAVGRLVLISGAVMLFTFAVLIGFASWLSWRIRRLAKETRRAIDVDGRVVAELTPSKGTDELSELRRNYAQLLAKVSEYSHYQQTLARKLSHELRTPLAVVKSSLDNLAIEQQLHHSDYLTRATAGANRLSAILNALSESARVEQIIQSAVRHPVALDSLLQSVSEAYDDIHARVRIRYRAHPEDGTAEVALAADLFVQALDKIIQNAVDFTPDGETIWIVLHVADDQVRVEISNPGPQLPAQSNQIFDNLFSARQAQGETPHLGLGLYIARLIVEFHDASLQAENRPDGAGVKFSINF